jgi:hypothetical protein
MSMLSSSIKNYLSAPSRPFENMKRSSQHKNLKQSAFCDAVQGLLEAASNYSQQIVALSNGSPRTSSLCLKTNFSHIEASETFATALETLAKTDPELAPTNDIMSCAGIHYLIGNYFRILVRFTGHGSFSHFSHIF